MSFAFTETISLPPRRLSVGEMARGVSRASSFAPNPLTGPHVYLSRGIYKWRESGGMIKLSEWSCKSSKKRARFSKPPSSVADDRYDTCGGLLLYSASCHGRNEDCENIVRVYCQRPSTNNQCLVLCLRRVSFDNCYTDDRCPAQIIAEGY